MVIKGCCHVLPIYSAYGTHGACNSERATARATAQIIRHVYTQTKVVLLKDPDSIIENQGNPENHFNLGMNIGINVSEILISSNA
jgi:hypothetical protein